ncbi:Elongation factor 1-alpha [Diplonema papillatum]|nr:Elongation factor 1-alpha [Diplonema papillatum]|eukprot:gene18442-28456_t
MEPERRMDSDGRYYTKQEFVDCYGDEVKWEGCPPETRAAAAEKRIDPADGNAYTQTQFAACYGGTAHWEKAKEEHRRDPADGKAYTHSDFVVQYKGEYEWDHAKPVGDYSSLGASAPAQPKADDKKEAAASATPPPSSGRKSTTPPRTDEKKADTKPRSNLPGRKEERKVDAPMNVGSSGGGSSLPGRKTERKPNTVVVPPPELLEKLREKHASALSTPEKSPAASLKNSPRSVSPKPKPPLSASDTAAAALHAHTPPRAAGLSETPNLAASQMYSLAPTILKDSDGRAAVNVVVVGHVDAGKSTLMGHLLVDLEVIGHRLLHKYEKESKAIGKASFHYAWVLDETEEERERGVTMDVATQYFCTATKRVTLLDAPGHSAFVGNCVNGASQADAAVVVLCATPGEFETGLERGQTREHIYILRGAGVKHLIVAVNKIDAVSYAEERFLELQKKLGEFLWATGFKKENVAWVPVSGLAGDNLVKPSSNMAWWTSKNTLLDCINNLPDIPRYPKAPLRMSIGDVNKGSVGGRIETGTVETGCKVVILPSNQVATVKTVERNQCNVREATSGDNVELHLQNIDQQHLYIGCSVSLPDEFRAKLCTTFEAQVLVVSDSTFITKSLKFVLYVQSAHVDAAVTRMLPHNGKTSRMLTVGKTGIVQITASRPICVEVAAEFRGFGRIVMRSGGATLALGSVTKVYPIDPKGD